MFCSYTPLELFDAAGVSIVGLCGTSNEPIADAEKVLPKNLCPLIKSSYGFAYTDKCPYTYFCDFIVGETTCDGKKMFELLNDIKETQELSELARKGKEITTSTCRWCGYAEAVEIFFEEYERWHTWVFRGY